ncbi:hypothetical protein D3C71_2211890 [compost metagenome]
MAFAADGVEDAPAIAGDMRRKLHQRRCIDLAEQLFEPRLALDERETCQVLAILLDQVESKIGQ